MPGKLLSIDLDGTLLNAESQITQNSRRVLQEFLLDHPNNIVILNSGRPMAHMKSFSEKLLDGASKEIKCRTYLASDNGCWLTSLIIGDIYKEDLDRELTNELWRESIEKGFNPFLHSLTYTYFGLNTQIIKDLMSSHRNLGANKYYKQVTDLVEITHPLTIQKFMLVEDDDSRTEIIEKFLIEKANTYNLNYVSSEKRFFMLTDGKVTKQVPIDMLLKKYKIPKKNAYVFGDSDNDIPALLGTDNVLVPKSADKDIHKYATQIIDHHNEEGVAKYIEENLLSNNKK